MDLSGFKIKRPKIRANSPLQELANEIFNYAKALNMKVPYGRILGRIKTRGGAFMARAFWNEIQRDGKVRNAVKVFLSKDIKREDK